MIIQTETDMTAVAQLVVGELAKSRMRGDLAEMQWISEAAMLGFLAGYFAAKTDGAPDLAPVYRQKMLVTHPMVAAGIDALFARYPTGPGLSFTQRLTKRFSKK